MPNTQKEITVRPDRPLTNTNHVCVEAHGVATPEHVEESDFDGHIPGEFERKGENDERVEKVSKVAERHVTSKNGLDVAKERKAHVASKRVESEQGFKSKRLSVNHK